LNPLQLESPSLINSSDSLENPVMLQSIVLVSRYIPMPGKTGLRKLRCLQSGHVCRSVVEEKEHHGAGILHRSLGFFRLGNGSLGLTGRARKGRWRWLLDWGNSLSAQSRQSEGQLSYIGQDPLNCKGNPCGV
jgi:hypothetical protein